MNKRVVVTGMGVVSPVGTDIPTYWKNLRNGVCGIDIVPEYKEQNLSVTIAAKVKNFQPENYGMDKPFVRKQDKFTLFAMAAAYQAMEEAGLKVGENISEYRLGVYLGTGIGGFETQYRETEKMIEDPSGQWISPLFIATMIGNIAAGQIAIKYGAKGPCLDIVTACATSANTIGEAFRAIQHGQVDAIIAGGSENPCIPFGIAAFSNSRALAREENPNYASLPFNANRKGFVMGEGAGVLVLEEYEHAVARGAKILAEIVGYGHTCDAHHVTAPNPSGETQAMAIKMALQEAQYKENQEELYINAHGTGTKLNDACETLACKLALGENQARKANISSTKSMTGHLLGAAGAIEAIATVLALEEGIIPPTINLDTPDPECDLNYTPNVAVERPISLALSNSFGFGGHNVCLAFRKVAK